MKKNMYLFIIILLTFFIGLSPVKASTCSNINSEIKKYNSIEKKLSNIDCTKDTDSKIVNKCNKLNLKKSASLTNLYRMKQQNSSCKSTIKRIDKILDSNKENCSKISDGLLEDFTSKFLLVFYIIGPIATILFGSLDYTKAVMSSDKDALSKTTKNFFKRIAALILLFLTPALINILISVNQSDYILSGDGYSCKSDYIVLKKTYTITYQPDEDNSSGGSSGKGSNKSSKGLIAGDYDGYLIRTSKPTMSDKKYYNPAESNTGQCVWYVRNRAKEILSTVTINEVYRKKAINAVTSTHGNAKDWWKNSGLSMFGSSNDVSKPKVGAIIVFGSCTGHQYGHVAMVEKVNTNSSGKVTSIDYSEGWTNSGSCPNTGMSCVQFKYRTKVKLANVKINNSGEPFLGYVYLLD